MKDASPRIFRSLETTAGRDGFDMIVTAAVASYGALRTPSVSQARDFARLVVPFWDKIGVETRRSLAAALSNAPRVPREIVERLLVEPVEVAAPFLIASPVLRPDDLARLAESGDKRIARILVGRSKAGANAAQRDRADFADRPSALIREARALPDANEAPSGAGMEEPISSALPIGGDSFRVSAQGRAVVAAPPLVPDLVPERAFDAPYRDPRPMADAAEATRETLRRLVRPGGRSGAASRRAVTTFDDVLYMALDGDADGVYDAVAVLLGIDRVNLDRMKADETGERLAVALRALRTNTADAMTVLMMTKPSIGYSVAAFESLALYFKALRADECAALFPTGGAGPAPKALAPSRKPSLDSPYEDDAHLRHRPATPPAFGRRRTMPVAIKPYKLG